MALLSFLQRNRSGAREVAAAVAPTAEQVQQARVRARQRLVGAVVLLGVGIVAFPLLFETQPRPLPVDVSIQIPRKDAAVPLAVPPAPVLITESAAEAGREVPPPVGPAASAPAPALETVRPPEKADANTALAPVQPAAEQTEKKVEKKVEKAAEPPAERSAVVERPRPVSEARVAGVEKAEPRRPAPASAPAAKDGEAKGRYIVQVGAFADPGTAREARIKVEKLGIKTFTQVVETDAGKRIRVRVGPFASREEADKALGKLKSAGLPTALLSL